MEMDDVLADRKERVISVLDLSNVYNRTDMAKKYLLFIKRVCNLVSVATYKIVRSNKTVGLLPFAKKSPSKNKSSKNGVQLKGVCKDRKSYKKTSLKQSLRDILEGIEKVDRNECVKKIIAFRINNKYLLFWIRWIDLYLIGYTVVDGCADLDTINIEELKWTEIVSDVDKSQFPTQMREKLTVIGFDPDYHSLAKAACQSINEIKLSGESLHNAAFVLMNDKIKIDDTNRGKEEVNNIAKSIIVIIIYLCESCRLRSVLKVAVGSLKKPTPVPPHVIKQIRKWGFLSSKLLRAELGITKELKVESRIREAESSGITKELKVESRIREAESSGITKELKVESGITNCEEANREEEYEVQVLLTE